MNSTARNPIWQPAIPLSQIAKRCRDSAVKLQRALRRVLVLQDNPNVTRLDRERIGLEDYQKEFGARISDRYLRELVKRAIDRDGGLKNWERLEIYLPEKLIAKAAPALSLSESVEALFNDISNFISTCANPAKIISSSEQSAIWALVFKAYRGVIQDGTPAKRAARQVREFLLERAPSLAPSRDALLKSFTRRLEKVESENGELTALRDQRANNGDAITIPEEHLDRLRSSAAFKNGARIDAAWREEYSRLSHHTRNQYPLSPIAPRKIHELLVRKKVDALWARHQGKRTLRRLVGGVERDFTGVPSMHEWVVDDMTSNIEVAFVRSDGTKELLLPQIVAVMDTASRKFVGWAISNDKGPTAELSCAAVLDGFYKEGVPHGLGVENGFVFGKSLNINGKEDERGRTVVAGLAQYGCTVRHFDKMNPTSKAELEKGFDLIQQRQERHPGYTGRLQMVDAPEEFKRQGRLIRSGKIDATEFRYTLSEFVEVMAQIFTEYNSTPQRGHLQGLSPNEAHEILKDKGNPAIRFTPEMEWMLANERYRVPVEVGGVRFTHYGRSIRVRGGRLTELVGSELWALVRRSDDSLVTFMSLDFTEPFTLEACQKPSASERFIAPGSGVLGRERAKVREHERAVDDEYKDLIQRYGNPRRDLLLEIRNKQVMPSIDSARPVYVSKRLAESAAAMNQQREEIKAEKTEQAKRTRNLKRRAEHVGVPSILVDDDEESREALELLNQAKRQHAKETASKTYVLDPDKMFTPKNHGSEREEE